MLTICKISWLETPYGDCPFFCLYILWPILRAAESKFVFPRLPLLGSFTSTYRIPFGPLVRKSRFGSPLARFGHSTSYTSPRPSHSKIIIASFIESSVIVNRCGSVHNCVNLSCEQFVFEFFTSKNF